VAEKKDKYKANYSMYFIALTGQQSIHNPQSVQPSAITSRSFSRE